MSMFRPHYVGVGTTKIAELAGICGGCTVIAAGAAVTALLYDSPDTVAGIVDANLLGGGYAAANTVEPAILCDVNFKRGLVAVVTGAGGKVVVYS